MKHLKTLAVLSCLVGAGCNAVSGDVTLEGAQAGATDTTQAELRKPKMFRVTGQNVTAANVLSPPLVIVQNSDFRLFSVGSAASPGVAEVAETGSTATLETELTGASGVSTFVKSSGGPVLAGQSRTIEVVVPAGVRASRLTLIAMIGKSNDSFVSRAEAIDLSLTDFGAIVVPLSNFDAGSEENTGNTEDFGRGGHPTASAEGLVSYDRGLNPRGNAPDLISWGSTAGIVRIERMY